MGKTARLAHNTATSVERCIQPASPAAPNPALSEDKWPSRKKEHILLFSKLGLGPSSSRAVYRRKLGKMMLAVQCAVPHSFKHEPGHHRRLPSAQGRTSMSVYNLKKWDVVWCRMKMHFHGGEEEEKKNKTLQMNAETAENYRIFIDNSQPKHPQKNVGRGTGTILHIGTSHIMCKIRQNTSIYLTI